MYISGFVCNTFFCHILFPLVPGKVYQLKQGLDNQLHCTFTSDDYLFPGDLTIHTSSPDINVINSEIQTDLGRTKTWRKRNKMTIHCIKTKYMLLGARHRLDDNIELSLYIDDNCIEKVTKQKLLGVFIDENLSWTPHTDHLCSLISTKISLLKQLAEYVP